MMDMAEPTETRLDALTLHTVKTSKYKTNMMILKLRAPLTEKDVTKRALIPHVLQSATENSPTAKQLHSRLNDLYGASLSVHLSKKGDAHIISIRMEVANENYLSNTEPLLEKAVRLLAEVLLQPKTEGGQLAADTIAREKRAMKQRIEAVRDDKMRYANVRLIEEMCKDEPYHLHALGKETEIDALTPQDLTTYYHRMLTEDEIDLYIVGDIDDNQTVKQVQNAFTISGRAPVSVPATSISAQVPKAKVVTEQDDMEQGKLNLGYQTYTTFGDEDYYALQVFNGVFGGFPHSKLFANVREKASLAYYTASKIESHKGLLIVFSGIATSNYDQAVAIIGEQLEKMGEGEITDEEFNQTKAMLNHQLMETFDHAGGIIEFFYNSTAAGYRRTFQDWQEGICAVTKDDVVRIANRVKLDTTYFLKGKVDGQ